MNDPGLSQRSSNTPVIREATVEDALPIARVWVDTWRSVYAGIMPAEYLAGLAYDERAQRIREILETNADFGRFFLVAERRGEIVGFAFGGPERTGDEVYKGEIYAIYILPAYQRQGLGRKLIGASVRRLRQAGVETLLIWVLSANPYRRFYEVLGGQRVREREVEIGGVSLPAVGYGWSDLQTLVDL